MEPSTYLLDYLKKHKIAEPKAMMFDNFLPEGWQKFSNILFYSANKFSIEHVRLDIVNGVLYVKSMQETFDDEMFNRFTRTISQDSAKTCMVCGEFGRRRKDLEHKPALCRKHHLEYINGTSLNV